MRVALAQVNSTVGDFSGNRVKILEMVRKAADLGADLVLFPELSLFGYPPLDLLERASVIDAQLREFRQLQKEIPSGIAVLVGVVTHSEKKTGKPYRNAAVLCEKGKKPKSFFKELLPTYDVFDEARFVERGDLAQGLFRFKGQRVQMTICEDIWGWDLPKYKSPYLENPLKKLKRGSCDLVLNMSASPYVHNKISLRRQVVRQVATHFGAPVVYVNAVGAQDELVFDGGSFVMDPKGKVLCEAAGFREDLVIYDTARKTGEKRTEQMTFKKIGEKRTAVELTREALVLGIRDFVRKTGLERVHLGLSGGIDSAVVACLAVDALGAENVAGYTMPGPYSADISRSLAERLGQNLDIRVQDIPIQATYETALQTLQSSIGELEFGLVHENLQSRLRGLFMMAIANKDNSLLLTTGNKSEYATGYATLYGDMCGGLAPIGDLVKGEVYDLARLYNRTQELIPDEIITRSPSAELRPNQKDQDTLPPYDDLDAAVRRLVEEGRPARSKMEHWLMATIARTEFKRWQAAPILKVSAKAFGLGRRYPLASRARV
ncbi:MAG: NAD+ synthase [Bdellovibrionaceae bacterium]|nr:NAD+ synthase [Pseudobdellovibrionaceae bacterium]